MLMKIRFLILIPTIFFFTFSSSLAQKDENSNDQSSKEVQKPLLIGGSLGLQLGTVTFIDVSPKVGYRWTENFATGIGGTYKYSRDKRFNGDYSTYGGSIFAQHDIWNEIFAYAEFEHLQYEGYNPIKNKLGWIKSNNLLFGGGYRQWFSRSAYAYMLILYNFNETYTTSNPVIRTGFLIRL